MNKYLKVVTSALVGSMARNWRGPRGVNFICLKEVRFSKSGRGNSQCKDLVARQNLVSQRGSKEAAVDGGSRGGGHGNQGSMWAGALRPCWGGLAISGSRDLSPHGSPQQFLTSC